MWPQRLRRHLILKMKSSCTRGLEGANRPSDAEGIPISGVGVGDHRNVHGIANTAANVHRFTHADQADIGKARKGGRDAEAGDGKDLGAGSLTDTGGHSVIRAEDQARIRFLK